MRSFLPLLGNSRDGLFQDDLLLSPVLDRHALRLGKGADHPGGHMIAKSESSCKWTKKTYPSAGAT